jgi:succinate-semialdehyde dehydrogenase/glutarate-semialdehyde dehydrogenase
MPTDASSSYVMYEPLGPILAVMPWNFPFWQVFRFATPTIMAGNTALLKHASNVQGCAFAIESLFEDAGFQKGIFTNVPVGSAMVRNILEDNRVKAVSLTGSEAAGSAVASRAGELIKRSLLELGGNNAFVVLDDANLKEAIDVAMKARLQNGGQSCIAAKRFILHKTIAGDFIRRLKEELPAIKMGDPLLPETDLGPLSSMEQADEVNDQVKRSLEMGAVLEYGGRGPGCFFRPTLLLAVNQQMPVFREEVFGPIFSISIAGNDEEALALVNESRFGLGATVFTNNMIKAERFIRGIKDGAVFINALVKSDPRLPFGGTGKSGYGRELSRQGILEFVNCKTIYINNI